MTRHSYLLLALLPLAANAATWPVELEQQLNGSAVIATPQAIDRDLAGLQLANHGPHAVVCSAVFRNGPQAPRTRRVALQPGDSKALVVKFRRDVIRLRIGLTCTPQ